MMLADPNISDGPPVIRQLDAAAINRIAAGEVVERPASAVKELVENALDAGATRVLVEVADGGKSLIRVSDNGCGIAACDLPLALSRHATSKIDGTDLLNIHTFGFRGEALPSLGAVGRLTIASRVADAPGAQITVTGGMSSDVRPVATPRGTIVTLRDLFFATPARLKFLRSDRAELQAVSDLVKRLAMVAPQVSITLRDASGSGRELLRVRAEQGALFDALKERLGDVMGRAFAQNSVAVDATRDGIRMYGYAGLPTFSRGAAVAQFLFVNGRPVRDKLLLGALRAAYSDFLSRDRHPAAALFIDCSPTFVDVNVHPAKAEVRFREPGLVRGLLISGLRHALAEAGHRASSTVADATLGAMRSPVTKARVYQMDRRPLPSASPAQTRGFAETAHPFARLDAPTEEPATQSDEASDYPLGTARGQVHENYIIAQTEKGMVIVDQHAAHERLVYERLKEEMAAKGVAAQALLIPEIVELSEADVMRLLSASEDLARLGLLIERFGGSAIAVRETPAILGIIDARGLLLDILDELTDQGESLLVGSRIDAILSRIACHGSIRSGRRMRTEEMNALLREMEAVPHSGQCNHGRPTYVELPLRDIERLFGRT
ncbi:MAG: DNA mismatch repair endonuclease MutL [Pseudomonadota bacterium]